MRWCFNLSNISKNQDLKLTRMFSCFYFDHLNRKKYKLDYECHVAGIKTTVLCNRPEGQTRRSCFFELCTIRCPARQRTFQIIKF